MRQFILTVQTITLIYAYFEPCLSSVTRNQLSTLVYLINHEPTRNHLPEESTAHLQDNRYSRSWLCKEEMVIEVVIAEIGEAELYP